MGDSCMGIERIGHRPLTCFMLIGGSGLEEHFEIEKALSSSDVETGIADAALKRVDESICRRESWQAVATTIFVPLVNSGMSLYSEAIVSEML